MLTPALISPTGDLLTKQHEVLTHAEVRVLQAVEKLCTAHRLQFQFRCRNCFEYYSLADGCKGGDESGDWKVVIECRCTRRVGVI